MTILKCFNFKSWRWQTVQPSYSIWEETVPQPGDPCPDVAQPPAEGKGANSQCAE